MRDHIDLSEPCILGTRTQWSYYGEARPGLHRCHCCDNDTTKDQICLNPKHWFYGTPSENSMMRSDEARQAGGKTHKGRKQSSQQIARRAAANTGKKRTPEQCERMRQAQLNRKNK